MSGRISPQDAILLLAAIAIAEGECRAAHEQIKMARNGPARAADSREAASARQNLYRGKEIVRVSTAKLREGIRGSVAFDHEIGALLQHALDLADARAGAEFSIGFARPDPREREAIE